MIPEASSDIKELVRQLKKLPVLVASAMMLANLVGAQGTVEEIKNRTLDSAIKFAQTAYEKIRQGGKPYADRLIKAAPKYYKETERRLDIFGKELGSTPTVKSALHKKEMLLQLWQMRGAIDALALADPTIVSNLTGLKVEQVTEMRTRVHKLMDTVNKLKP